MLGPRLAGGQASSRGAALGAEHIDEGNDCSLDEAVAENIASASASAPPITGGSSGAAADGDFPPPLSNFTPVAPEDLSGPTVVEDLPLRQVSAAECPPALTVTPALVIAAEVVVDVASHEPV